MIELNVDGAKKKLKEENGVELDFWEEIFWQNNKIQINNPKKLKEKLDDEIYVKLNMLYDLANQPKNFEIKVEGNKDLERQFEGEIKAHIARGEQQEAAYLNKYKQKALEELAKTFGEKQFEEYRHLVINLQNSNYPDSFKALILDEALNYVYRTISKDGQEILKVEKRKPHQTIFGLPNFPDSVLKYIFEHGATSSSFKELYANAQKEYLEEISKSSGVSFKNVDTFGKGEWVLFKGKKNDPEHYEENVAKLKALVQETPWCTKTLASTHLDQGDFYVFVDENKKPHIAVKMTGNSIDEVRGIQNGNAQELEDDYRDVAINFLENNQNIKDGKEWLEKEEWNKRLVLWKEQIENGTFEAKNVGQLLKDLSHHDFRSHGRNSNLENLKDIWPKAKPQIAEFYQVPEEEVYVGNFRGEECPYSVVVGDVDGSVLKKAGKLKVITGDACFTDSPIKDVDLSNLTTIGRHAFFKNSQVKDLRNLKTVGGCARFNYCHVENLSNLTTIGYSADFAYCNVTDLSSLKAIGGDADFIGSQVTNLRSLATIAGNANFVDSQVEDLSSLKTIGGYGSFLNSKVKDLSSLISIGGDALFKNSQVEDLSSLVTIGGDADFSYSQVKDLRSLKIIGKNAGEKVNDGNFIFGRVVYGDAIFLHCPVDDLSSLESVGGIVLFEDKIPKIDSLEKCSKIIFNEQEITLAEAKELTKTSQTQPKTTKTPELTT